MLKEISVNNNQSCIIFIHGLTGSTKTWINTNGDHLGNLLHKDEILYSAYDIYDFSYYTKPLSTQNGSALRFVINKIIHKNITTRFNLSIKDIASIFESETSEIRSAYSQTIIISHSMGGIISRICALNNIKNFDTSISTIITLATPHLGSEFAILGTPLHNPDTEDLRPFSDIIQETNAKWINTDKLTLPQVYCFSAKYDNVVHKHSSTPLLQLCDKTTPVDAEHTNIARPENTQSKTYKHIKKAILDNYLQQRLDQFEGTDKQSIKLNYKKTLQNYGKNNIVSVYKNILKRQSTSPFTIAILKPKKTTKKREEDIEVLKFLKFSFPTLDVGAYHGSSVYIITKTHDFVSMKNVLSSIIPQLIKLTKYNYYVGVAQAKHGESASSLISRVETNLLMSEEFKTNKIIDFIDDANFKFDKKKAEKEYGVIFFETEMDQLIKSIDLSSIIVFDVDKMSAINKVFGSHIGNQVIADILVILKDFNFKHYGRCGDDTFFVLLPGADIDRAEHTSRQIAKAMHNNEWDHIADNLNVTCTFGFAERQFDESAIKFAIRARIAVNKAKEPKKRRKRRQKHKLTTYAYNSTFRKASRYAIKSSNWWNHGS